MASKAKPTEVGSREEKRMLKSGRTGAYIVSIATLAILGISGSAFGVDSSGPCRIRKDANVPAKMRDGTILYADIYRPVEEGAYPVLLIRLPYDKLCPIFCIRTAGMVRGAMLHRGEPRCSWAIHIARNVLPVPGRNE